MVDTAGPRLVLRARNLADLLSLEAGLPFSGAASACFDTGQAGGPPPATSGTSQ